MNRFVCAWIFGLWFPAACIVGAESFLIQFRPNQQVAFSGTIPSKEMADDIANAIVTASSDRQIVNVGLNFAPETNFPDLELFKSLAVEIALSTHEGVIEVSDERILVGGLSDSALTASVLRLRAEPLLGKHRTFQEQVCLVPSEDLPEIRVLLSTGETRKPFTFDLEMKTSAEVSFEPPGFLLQKLPGLIAATRDISKMVPDPPQSKTKEDPPTLPPENTDEAMTEAANALAEVLAPEDDPYQHFGPIYFSRNSHLFQSGQTENITGIAEQLNTEPWAGKPVTVRVLVYASSGNQAFSEWLGDRRKTEITKALASAGVPESRIRPEVKESTNPVDEGEVKILVEKQETEAPPPPAENPAR